MIIPRQTPPPLFFENYDRLFFAQFSDHLRSQVHNERNFGKFFGEIWAKQCKWQNNSLQQIGGKGQDVQTQICQSLYELWSLEWTQSLFYGFLEQNSYVWSIAKKELWSPPLTPPPPVGYDHDHRFNGYFFNGFPNSNHLSDISSLCLHPPSELGNSVAETSYMCFCASGIEGKVITKTFVLRYCLLTDRICDLTLISIT